MSAKRKLISVVALLIAVFACFSFGCGAKSGSSSFASNKNVVTAEYENKSACYYVQVDVMTDDKSIVLNSDDFTYEQNGETKTAQGFILQTRTSSVTVNGVTTSVSYVSKTGKEFTCEADYLTHVLLIIESDAPVMKISHKGSAITKTSLI